MTDAMLTLCQRFIENRDIIKSTFSWENSYLYPVCAAIFTDRRRTADPAQLKACRDLLRQLTGPFSNFRGTVKLAAISMAAAGDQPENLLTRGMAVYRALKAHFHSSPYLPVAAMVLASQTEPARDDEVSARAKRIYQLMKQAHPFLTAGEDSVFAARLALSPQSDEAVTEEAERCYTRLKPAFRARNAVQSLSHVLALGEASAAEKCERTLALYEKLKAQGYAYGIQYELATLGALALLPGAVDTLAADTAEAADWLAAQKGYGFFGAGKKQRLMHASMLVTSAYIGAGQSAAMGSAALSAVVSLVVAQQVAICAAIAASSAASSSAS